MTSWACHVRVRKILMRFLSKMETCNLDRHNRQQDEEALFSLLCGMLELFFQSLADAGQDYAKLATNVKNDTSEDCIIALSTFLRQNQKECISKFHMILFCGT